MIDVINNMTFQRKYTEDECLSAGNIIYYPINTIFNDETKINKIKNLQMWKQIQPEIQSAAQDIIYNIKVVELAINHIRNGNTQTMEYEKRFNDCIYAIFSIGKEYFDKWIELCDKELNYEYSNEVFQYETDTRKHCWISFSLFMNHEKLKNYFNACLLMAAVELMTINQTNINIIRNNYSHLHQFCSSIQDKFEIMDYYYPFNHRWKGSKYYNTLLFSW